MEKNKIEGIKKAVKRLIASEDFYLDVNTLLDCYNIAWACDRITLFNELEKAHLTNNREYKTDRIAWTANYIVCITK